MEKKDLNDKILESTTHFEVNAKLSVEEAWFRIEPNLQNRTVENVIERKINYTFLKWAASIALVLSISLTFLIVNGSKEISNASLENLEFELPDGSKLSLAQNSNLSFNSFTWNLNRKVELSGEAYFEVEKGEKFTVQTSQGKVRVLGTVFSVLQEENVFEVYCLEGKVGVESSKSDEEVFLTEGKATELLNNKLVKPFAFSKEKLVAHRNGLFYFEKDNLSEVFQEFMDYYNLQISFEGEVGMKNFSGVFKKDNLENSLEIVCSSMGLEYSIDANSVIIKD